MEHRHVEINNIEKITNLHEWVCVCGFITNDLTEFIDHLGGWFTIVNTGGPKGVTCQNV